MATLRSKTSKIGNKRELESDDSGDEDTSKSISQQSKSKKQKTQTASIGIKIQKPSSTRVIILPKLEVNSKIESEKSENENKELGSIIQLPHPKNKQRALFILSADANKLYELKSYSKNHQTIFLKEKILCDPKLYIATPFDPLYILVSLLFTHSTNKYLILSQILFDPTFKSLQSIINALPQERIELVCDIQTYEHELACMLNKDNTIAWLRVKVLSLAKKLPTLSSSQTSYQTMLNTEEGSLKYAISLISEYLPSELAAQLSEAMGYPYCNTEVVNQIITTPNINTKEENIGEKVKSKLKAPTKKISKSQKLLQETDKTGMKALSNFFTAKPNLTKVKSECDEK